MHPGPHKWATPPLDPYKRKNKRGTAPPVNRAEPDPGAGHRVEQDPEGPGDRAAKIHDGNDDAAASLAAAGEERKAARPGHDEFTERGDAVRCECAAVRDARAIAKGT